MLKDLAEILSANGVHVSLRRHRIVCAQSGGDRWIGGPGVWSMFHSGRWILATWAPRVYIFPEAASIDVVAAAIRDIVIERRNERLYSLGAGVQEKYGLTEVDANVFLERKDLPDELD